MPSRWAPGPGRRPGSAAPERRRVGDDEKLERLIEGVAEELPVARAQAAAAEQAQDARSGAALGAQRVARQTDGVGDARMGRRGG
jgi:hypothetical protein